MSKALGANYVPQSAWADKPVREYGINYERVMTTKERGRVRTRFRTWVAEHGYGMVEPKLEELRWSDDFNNLFVNVDSGMLAYFVSLYPEHAPVAAGKAWAIYNRLNPAADSLLSSIEQVTEGWR